MAKSADKDDKPSAYDRALGLLARREHSRRELATKLAVKGYGREEATSAIAALGERHEQSDERFAEVLIRQRVTSGYGPRYIAAELGSHGIAVAPFRAALDEIDWVEQAGRLVSRRYGDSPDGAARDKAAQFLTRRGFSGEVIARVLGRRR